MAQPPRRHLRALGPRTLKAYDRVLSRAYGNATGPFNEVPKHVLSWPEGSKAVLRSALVRATAEQGTPDLGYTLASQIPASHRIQRVKVELPEKLIEKIEQKAALRSRRDEALVMVPLRLGLRSEELLMLSREQVEEAVRTGTLVFVRKGAKEAALPCAHVRVYLQALLETPVAKARRRGQSLAAAGAPTGNEARAPAPVSTLTPEEEAALVADEDGVYRPRRHWATVGEVLAGPPAKFETRYNLLNRVVKKVGKLAGVDTLSPHQLRHAFATRLHRDGAPLAVVQAALGHSSAQTTEKYLHLGADEMRAWVRKK